MDIMFTRAKLVPIHTKDNVTWHDMYDDLNIKVDSHQKASHLLEKVSVATSFTHFFLIFIFGFLESFVLCNSCVKRSL
jgi:hypothetical protein